MSSESGFEREMYAEDERNSVEFQQFWEYVQSMGVDMCPERALMNFHKQRQTNSQPVIKETKKSNKRPGRPRGSRSSGRKNKSEASSQPIYLAYQSQ
jgi:hypothetical protein